MEYHFADTRSTHSNDFRERSSVEGRQHRHCEDFAGIARGLDGSFDHRSSPGRMHGRQSHVHCTNSTHRSGYGIRDVVKLEIEENVAVLVAQRFDYRRATCREQLAPHLVESAALAELTHQS
jgi:hypothetical protein